MSTSSSTSPTSSAVSAAVSSSTSTSASPSSSSSSTSTSTSTSTAPSSSSTSTSTSSSTSTSTTPSSTSLPISPSSSSSSTTSRSSTASSASSSSSSSSTTSSSLTVPGTGTLSTPSSTLIFTTSTSGGVVVTITTTPTGAVPSSSDSDRSGTNSGFFSNKGAVAGVFTVVGLVALALIIAIVTNAIRRRRARKFDEDVALAAAEAAKSPRYPFDDYDEPTAWSDHGSNGAYNQPPLQPGNNEYYNMHEIPGTLGVGAAYAGADRYPRPSFGTDASGPGVAGIGANAGNENRAGFGAPYNAFAVPGAPKPGEVGYDPANNGGLQRSGSQGSRDLLDATGLAGGAVAAGAGGAVLARGLSQNTNTSAGRSKESYAAHYQPDFEPSNHQYSSPAATPGSLSHHPSTGSMPNPHSPGISSSTPPLQNSEQNVNDAYGGDDDYYAPPQPSHGDMNPDDSRRSFRDDDDYGLRSRVLRVANE